MIPGQAFTDHSANWFRIEHLALGINSAWFDYLAWIHASAVDASRLRWAIGVESTHLFLFSTADLAVGVSRRACAFNVMVKYSTFR